MALLTDLIEICQKHSLKVRLKYEYPYGIIQDRVYEVIYSEPLTYPSNNKAIHEINLKDISNSSKEELENIILGALMYYLFQPE